MRFYRCKDVLRWCIATSSQTVSSAHFSSFRCQCTNVNLWIFQSPEDIDGRPAKDGQQLLQYWQIYCSSVYLLKSDVIKAQALKQHISRLPLISDPIISHPISLKWVSLLPVKCVRSNISAFRLCLAWYNLSRYLHLANVPLSKSNISLSPGWVLCSYLWIPTGCFPRLVLLIFILYLRSLYLSKVGRT